MSQKAWQLASMCSHTITSNSENNAIMIVEIVVFTIMCINTVVACNLSSTVSGHNSRLHYISVKLVSILYKTTNQMVGQLTILFMLNHPF